jgi:Major Facilitator Superfamily
LSAEAAGPVSGRTARALDLLNFFLADVRDLDFASRHWSRRLGFRSRSGGHHVGSSRHEILCRRIGRNESFNHAGNATAGAITGGLAYCFGPAVVLWVLAAMALLSVVAALRIPGDAIDHDVARGMDHSLDEAHPQPSGFAVLVHDRRLLIFAAAMVTFHLANAAMLPLVGQVSALRNTDVGTALMATCIVAAQVVMVPMAYLAGAKADSWGRKPILSSDSLS